MNSKQVEIFSAFLRILKDLDYSERLLTLLDSTNPVASKYEKLGEGYELRPIELKDKKGNPIVNKDNYSHLYSEGKKISNEWFRMGGRCMGFREGYCELIHYLNETPGGFGQTVLINKEGKIILSGKSSLSSPSHLGGNLGSLDGTFYNLLTGKPVLKIDSTGYINSKNFLIIEHRYNWKNKDLPLGVYKIDKGTCEYEKIDDIKV